MDNAEFQDFAGNWMCLQTLGEGAYGEVKLLMHRVSGETLAVKIVNLDKHKDASECVRKEVCIHSLLDHENVIKLYGNRREPTEHIVYIYLEYAAGGELFNQIEPDIGMNFIDAQKYMKQLLAGVDYLHKKGIAHRDIKPENLLVDGQGNLKISDFGMATIYRLRGRERLLNKKCGTLPYVAPEVLTDSYAAQPADIWSCGIVLIAMVTGELPWDEPIITCQEFLLWSTDQYLLITPWSKLNNTLLSLAKKMLTIDPNTRPTISQICQHPWMQTVFTASDSSKYGKDTVDCTTHNRQLSMSDNADTHQPPGIALSQPVPLHLPGIASDNLTELLKTNVCFSQPTQNDNLIVNSQMQFTQTPLTQNNFKHLIRRMTRFFVSTGGEKTVELLGNLLDRLLYTWNADASGVFTISTVDSRKMQLVFKATLIDMDGELLVDFRLAKGCGLEFKRRFIKLRSCFSDIIVHKDFHV